MQVLASFVYDAATRPEMLPRKPVPAPLPPKREASCQRHAGQDALGPPELRNGRGSGSVAVAEGPDLGRRAATRRPGGQRPSADPQAAASLNR